MKAYGLENMSHSKAFNLFYYLNNGYLWKKLVYNKESYIRSLYFLLSVKEQLHYTAIYQDQSTGNEGDVLL